MPNMLENYGLDISNEDEDGLERFVSYVIKDGKLVYGYYNEPYVYKSLGDAEYWLTTKKTEDEKFDIIGVNTHCSGTCVWEMMPLGIDLTPSKASHLNRVIMFNSCDGSGLLPIHLLGADVLPSFRKFDKIKMQMIALPIEINYYTDVDEFQESFPEDKSGKKLVPDVGIMAPAEFLYNHSPDHYEQGKEYETDDFVLFSAKVKALYHGIFKTEKEEIKTFIRCIADTNFGELEFNHTIDQVSENLRDNIKIGAVIDGVCILSGDVAILEYNNGIIKDFDHNLRLLRYTLEDGDPKRLGAVLAESAIFETETYSKTYNGPKNIIDRFIYVQENKIVNYTAHLATIVSTDEADMEYSVGTRCIVLETDKEEGYESIVFMEINDDGMITKIKVCRDGRYRFEIDKEIEGEQIMNDKEIEELATELLERCTDNSEEIEKEIMDDEKIEKLAAELLERCTDEFEEIEKFIERYEGEYSDDLADFIFRLAIRLGKKEYVEEYAGEFDLNDSDHSTYLDETEDEEMKEILMNNGAYKSWDDYSNCSFAMETINGTILTFDPEFQKQIFDEYLKNFNFTIEKLEMIVSGKCNNDTGRYVEEDLKNLGVHINNGEVSFDDMCDYEEGGETKDLLEELGWDCDFEGDSWKLEVNGVYFIN